VRACVRVCVCVCVCVCVYGQLADMLNLCNFSIFYQHFRRPLYWICQTANINVQYLFVIDAVVVTVMQVVTFVAGRLKLPSHFPKVVGSRLRGEQSRAAHQNHSARSHKQVITTY